MVVFKQLQSNDSTSTVPKPHNDNLLAQTCYYQLASFRTHLLLKKLGLGSRNVVESYFCLDKLFEVRAYALTAALGHDSLI
ncbi:hypothetical protein L195_g010876 [Trifolium pratense]|uniref:Uncharacterized protein n=1 Tax=Trifolium pratense TaxID=57577 RepID=A0A2K3PFZ2_TRIPR|nr:hypothetical protein L195_g010876 [Trifolium pratense]